jgi:hypothetical protein
MSVVWEVLVDAVADVAVDAPALASAAQAQSCYGASPRGSVVIRDFSFTHLIRPRRPGVGEPDVGKNTDPVHSLGPSCSGGERRRDSPSQRGPQEAAAVHTGMVGRMRAKVNHITPGFSRPACQVVIGVHRTGRAPNRF